MATLNINGKKVTVDDSFLSLPPDQQEATVNEIAASFAPQEEESPWMNAANTVDAYGRAVANGATFGFADYAGAGARWLGGKVFPWQENVTYPEALQEVQGSDRALAEKFPIANMIGNITGGVGTALGASKAGLTLMGRGAPAAMTGLGGVAARTGVAGIEGAGYGALSALGNDEDVGTGALIGGAFGAGGNLIGEGVQAGINAFRGPQTRAQEYVANAAAADNLTPDSVAAQLAQSDAPLVLGDLGPNMRAQTSAIATTPGEGQSIVRSALNERSSGSGARITKAVDDAMGGRENVLALADDIVTRRRETAGPLYEASRSVPVPKDPKFDELMSRPSSKAAISQAEKNMLDRGEVFDLSAPTVGMIDEVKRAMDDLIGPAKRQGENAKVSSLTSLKNDIVSYADNVSDEYAQARQIFSDETSIINALDDGVKAFDNNMTPDALQKYLSGLDEASREAFITGARQKVANTMGTARGDAASVRSMFGKEYNAEKLRILLGDSEADKLLQSLTDEGMIQGTKNAALGGSDTIPKANARELIAGNTPNSGVIKSLLNLNMGDAAVTAVDKMFGGALANRDARTNAEIARLLMGNNPNMVTAPLLDQSARNVIARSLMGTGAVVGGQ